MKKIGKKRKWPLEKLQLEALRYKTSADFAKYSNGAYQAAYRMGVLELICRHMVGGYIHWTKTMILEQASKHNKIADFKREHPKAHDAAHRMGMMDEVRSHMTEGYEYYTTEEIQLEANKYLRIRDFRKYSSKHYWTAKRRGILRLVCEHMTSSGGISNLEKELFTKIQSIAPTSKKLFDRKVKIAGKPFIRGFEIDIFVPELNLGIEFDGKHWHSFKRMRADKRKVLWSDEDIRNYHTIKDDWFKTRGIQILHIKEEDWNINKQACIDKCLLFLGISESPIKETISAA
jgi:hypothetical protein